MSATQFEKKIEQAIADHKLFSHGDTVVAGVSGGCDSVALLLALVRLGHSVKAVHCNFMLRGDESDADEHFVRELCQKLNVSLTVEHFNTRREAESRGESVEMAARRLRYALFERLRVQMDAAVVCVAHHKADNAETFVLNLLRGSGIRGLRGIQWRNNRIVRPMLGVCREEIKAYLADLQQSFVTDSTNLQPEAALRNAVRLCLIPQMDKICNGNAIAAISRSEQILSEQYKIYHQAVCSEIKSHVHAKGNASIIAIEELMKTVSPQTLLYEWLAEKNFNFIQTEEALRAAFSPDEKTRSFVSPTGWRLYVKKGNFVLLPKLDLQPSKPILINHIGQTVKIKPVSMRLTTELLEYNGQPVPRNADTVWMDADKLALPLVLRNVVAGDRMRLLGFKRGSKLVNDILSDAGIAQWDRTRRYVVVDANGRVVWVVGVRLSQDVAITSETKIAACFSLSHF